MKGHHVSQSGRKRPSKKCSNAKKKSSRTKSASKSDPLASAIETMEQQNKTRSTSLVPAKNELLASLRTAKQHDEGPKKASEEEEVKQREKEKVAEEGGDKEKKSDTTTDHPKNVDITTKEVDERKVQQVLVKFRSNDLKPKRALAPLDAKERLLMDRVVKKPYPLKYTTKYAQKYAPKNQETVLVDETSSFFRPSGVTKKPSGSVISSQDTYTHVPKWRDVRKLPDDSILTFAGIPFWAELPEPTDNDTKDVEPPISVGSVHVEMYNDKVITLKTIKEKVTIDEWQPLMELMKRDDVHFHPHLVFSNTIRSLVIVQLPGDEHSPSKSNQAASTDRENRRHRRRSAHFDATNMRKFGYSRKQPILSARQLLAKEREGKSGVPVTPSKTPIKTTPTKTPPFGVWGKG